MRFARLLKAGCLCLAVASAGPVYAEDGNDPLYLEIHRQIEQARDLETFAAIGERIEREWGERDLAKYGYAMVSLVGRLSAQKLDDHEGRYVLGRRLVERARAKAGKIPLATELDLAMMIQTNPLGRGRPEGDAWARLREEEVGHLLRAWQRVEERLIQNAPTEPDAGETESEAARRRFEHHRASHLKRRNERLVEMSLVKQLSYPPHDLPAAEALLARFLRNEDDRTRILDAIRQRIDQAQQERNAPQEE